MISRTLFISAAFMALLSQAVNVETQENDFIDYNYFSQIEIEDGPTKGKAGAQAKAAPAAQTAPASAGATPASASKAAKVLGIDKAVVK